MGWIFMVDSEARGAAVLRGSCARWAPTTIRGVLALLTFAWCAESPEVFARRSSALLDTASNGDIHTMALQADAKIILGGQFRPGPSGGVSNVRGCPILCRLNSDGSADQEFRPSFDPSRYLVDVFSVVVQGQKMVIGGSFTVSDGNGSRHDLARLNSDGSIDPTFQLSANGRVICLVAQPDGKILVAGEFTELRTPEGPITRHHIARFGLDHFAESGAFQSNGR